MRTLQRTVPHHNTTQCNTPDLRGAFEVFLGHPFKPLVGLLKGLVRLLVGLVVISKRDRGGGGRRWWRGESG